jgi:hypothetical protein
VCVLLQVRIGIVVEPSDQRLNFFRFSSYLVGSLSCTSDVREMCVRS